jgi:hypothetical protein
LDNNMHNKNSSNINFQKLNEINYIYFLKNDNQFAVIYDIQNKTEKPQRIEGTILRVYSTPFVGGFVVLYRNALNELRYSKNFSDKDQFNFETSDFALMRLDYSEREVDIIWKVFFY